MFTMIMNTSSAWGSKDSLSKPVLLHRLSSKSALKGKCLHTIHYFNFTSLLTFHIYICFISCSLVTSPLVSRYKTCPLYNSDKNV